MEFVKIEKIRKLALNIINAKKPEGVCEAIDYLVATSDGKIKLDDNVMEIFHEVAESVVGNATLLAAVKLTLTENEIWEGDTSKEKMRQFVNEANELTRFYNEYKRSFLHMNNNEGNEEKI